MRTFYCFILFLVFSFCFTLSNAQKYSIEGQVAEPGGVAIQGVVIAWQGMAGQQQFVLSDFFGHFKILSNEGRIQVHFSHIGYEPISTFLSAGSTNQIVLKARSIGLEQINVTAFGTSFEISKLAIPVEVLKPAGKNQSFLSPSDLAAGEPGLAVSRDGAWGSGIQVRGMSEQRLVLMADGNRVETATDLAAGMSLIDIYSLDRVEIIKGASSSHLGSGALGGIVHFVSKERPYTDTLHFSGRVIAEMHSGNQLFAKHASTGFSSQKFKLDAFFTHRIANDLHTPKGSIGNSSFEDQALSVTIAARNTKNLEAKLKIQFFEARNVGIPGGAAFSPNAVADYRNASRFLLNPQLKYSLKNSFVSEIGMDVFIQNIERNVEMDPKSPPVNQILKRTSLVLVTPTGLHKTFGGKVVAKGDIANFWGWSGGVDTWQRNIETSREKIFKVELLLPDNSVDSVYPQSRGEQPIPDAWFRSAGLFLTNNFKLVPQKLSLDISGRADLITVGNKQSVDPVYIKTPNGINYTPVGQRVIFTPETNQQTSWSIDLSALYSPVKSFRFSAMVSKAFRAASLEERFKYIDLGTKVSLGNQNLKPEEAWFTNLGVAFQTERFNFKVDFFINHVTNYIAEEDGFFVYSYSDTALYGQLDTLPAKILGNIHHARLFGADGKMSAQLLSDIKIISTFSFVRGQNLTSGQSLPAISPVNASIGIGKEWPGRIGTYLQCRLIADQPKIAPGEKSSTGAAVYSAFVSCGPYKVSNFTLNINCGTENLFDRAYKNHLTTNRGFINYESGFNLFGRINLQF